jgi:hypothetical protein
MTREFFGDRPIGARIWQRVSTPIVVSGAQKVLRNIRYIALNPCRANLCADPISWMWSTHLDYVGARANPWVNTKKICSTLTLEKNDFSQWIHKYVSSDPSCKVSGSPLPNTAQWSRVPMFSLYQLAMASLIAHTEPSPALGMRGPARSEFLRLAGYFGLHTQNPVTTITGLSPQMISRAAVSPPSRAALICLGDDRISSLGRVWVMDWKRVHGRKEQVFQSQRHRLFQCQRPNRVNSGL